MQQTITKTKYHIGNNKALRSAGVLRALQTWREKIGRKISAWNDVKTIRTWRDKKA